MRECRREVVINAVFGFFDYFRESIRTEAD